VLSDARHAVVTADSTFGGSARARSGYFNGRWDLAVTREDVAGPAARADAAERDAQHVRLLETERQASSRLVQGLQALVAVPPLLGGPRAGAGFSPGYTGLVEDLAEGAVVSHDPSLPRCLRSPPEPA
jgi:hypothetical protein